jgi:hypothetical protein
MSQIPDVNLTVRSRALRYKYGQKGRHSVYPCAVDLEANVLDIDCGVEGEPTTALEATLGRWLRYRSALEALVLLADLLVETTMQRL